MPYEWKCDANKKFINPYNFVPLGFQCNRAGEDESEEKVTGYISCSIIPKTDLFIPNTSTDNAFNTYNESTEQNQKHKSYDFFSYIDLSNPTVKNTAATSDQSAKIIPAPEKPIIPGSELRGMLRSAYETLTNSCFSLDYDEKLYSRTPNPKNPGILLFENGRWELYSATTFKVNVYGTNRHRNPVYQVGFDDAQKIIYEKNKNDQKTKYRTGNIVKFENILDNGVYNGVKITEVLSKGNDANDCELLKRGNGGNAVNVGVLLIGEKIARKGFEHIFTIGSKITNATIDIENLISVLDLYRKNTVNLNLNLEGKRTAEKHYGYEGYDVVANRPIPVWYEKKSEKKSDIKSEINIVRYYLSPSCISKNSYYNTLERIVKNSNNTETGNFLPCSDIAHLCPACSLFGTVTNGGGSKSSKIRITDAQLCNGSKAIFKTPAPIKNLAGPKFRCLEFYTYLHGSNVNYWNFDFDGLGESVMDSIRLNGRKMYWHHPSNNYFAKPEDKTGQNITIRSLEANSNTKFAFKVYFDDISKTELQRLVAVLSLGNNTGDNCYKIGMGKPLGLGSIKITVDQICKRSLSLFNEKVLDCISVTEDYKPFFDGYFDFPEAQDEMIVEPEMSDEERYKQKLAELAHKYSRADNKQIEKQEPEKIKKIDEKTEKVDTRKQKLNTIFALFTNNSGNIKKTEQITFNRAEHKAFEEILSAFLRITNFNTLSTEHEGIPVTYPLALNEQATDYKEASYHWFSGERAIGANPMNPFFSYPLPKTDKEQALPKLINKVIPQNR